MGYNFGKVSPELARKRPAQTQHLNPAAYLQILFDDLTYDRLHRNDKLSLEFNREIKFIDELKPFEVSRMIDILRVEKYGLLKEKKEKEEEL